tara:strand:+ start:431 stop:568 length:138 start_codon:yes stop_codon:yes gene_type:complete
MSSWIKKNWWIIIIVTGVVLFLIWQQEYANDTQERIDRFIEEKKD